MAANAQTYSIRMDWSKGSAFGTVPGTGGYLSKLPSPLVANDSFELIVDHYEYYSTASSTKSDFGAAAVAKLYIIWYNVDGAIATELATGTVAEEETDGGYNRVTYRVPKDAISTDWAGTTKVMIFEEITYTDGSAVDHQRTAWQSLSIIDRNGTGTSTITAAGIADNYMIQTSSLINALVPGATTIYTVPTGKRLLINAVIWIWTTNDNDGANHTAEWGKSGDSDAILAAAAAYGDAANVIDRTAVTPATVFAAGDVIQYNVTVAATHTTATGIALIEGYLIDA